MPSKKKTSSALVKTRLPEPKAVKEYASVRDFLDGHYLKVHEFNNWLKRSTQAGDRLFNRSALRDSNVRPLVEALRAADNALTNLGHEFKNLEYVELAIRQSR